MSFEMNMTNESSFEAIINILTVIGLWFLICGVDKIPRFRNSMDFV